MSFPRYKTGIVLCAGLALILSATLIHFVSVNWPFSDDYITLQWFRSLFLDRTTSASSLFLQAGDGAHPLGLQAILTSLILYVLGINFKALTLLSFVMCIIAACAIALVAEKSLTPRQPKLFYSACVGSFLLFLQPAQLNDLLWPFEVGWVMINCLICINILLVETGGRKFILVSPIVATAAYFCSAQGICAWLVLAFHAFIKRDCAHRRTLISLAVLALPTEAYFLSKMDTSGRSAINLAAAPKLLLYQAGLLGGEFGIRSNSAAVVLGSLLVVLVVAFILFWLRQPKLTALARTGLTLCFASYATMWAFSVGRFQFGLWWAIAQFHSSMIVAPFGVGIFILATATLECQLARPPTFRSRPMQMFALLSCILLVSTFVTALRDASETVTYIKDSRELSLIEVCSPDTSSYVREHLVGCGFGFAPMLAVNRPLLEPLCHQPVSEKMTRRTTFPSRYQSMILADPSADRPLHTLWDVYMTHMDLMHDLPVKSDGSANRLLGFAHANALTGSGYATELLLPYADYFSHLTP